MWKQARNRLSLSPNEALIYGAARQLIHRVRRPVKSAFRLRHILPLRRVRRGVRHGRALVHRIGVILMSFYATRQQHMDRFEASLRLERIECNDVVVYL